MNPDNKNELFSASPKALTVAVALIALAGGIGWSFDYARPSGGTIAGATLFLCFSLLFTVLLSLFAMTSRSRALAVGVPIGVSVAFFISHPFSTSFLWGIIASTLLLVWGVQMIQRETAVRVRYHWGTIARFGMKKFFTAIALSSAILLLVSAAPITDPNEVLFPRVFFDATVIVLERPIALLIPGMDISSTVDDVLLGALVRAGGEIDVRSLPKSVLNGLIAVERRALNANYGLKLTGGERVSDVLYSVISGMINSYVAPYRAYLPYAMAAGYFITLQFVFVVLGYIGMRILPVAAWALQAVGILTKERIMVDKDVIVL